MAAERLLERVEDLIRAAGGLGRLRDCVGPVQYAKLAVRISDIADREQTRANEQIRREEEARASLSLPGMREACIQLLLEEMWRWPQRVPLAAASVCPREAYDSLNAVCPKRLTEWLIADGWAPPPAVAPPNSQV